MWSRQSVGETAYLSLVERLISVEIKLIQNKQEKTKQIDPSSFDRPDPEKS